MNKANIEELNGLDDYMAKYFTKLLQESMSDEGERLQPGELSAILKFLKDNEITADIVESKPMQGLIDSFLTSEEYEDAIGG